MVSTRSELERPMEFAIGQKALADATASLVFLFCFTLVGPLSEQVAPWLGLNPAGAAMALVIALLIAMGPMCRRLGGAIFNPANSAFLYALGKGGAREHLVRSVAQTVGSVAGGWLALELLPPVWTKHLPGLAVGLRPGAGLLDGAAAEFVLGLLITFVVLVSGELQSSVLKLWTPLLATVLAVKAGEDVSGPSLNPAFAFVWSFLYPGSQSAAEHLLVYWAAPLASGLFGGWCFLGWQQFTAQRRQEQEPEHAKAE